MTRARTLVLLLVVATLERLAHFGTRVGLGQFLLDPASSGGLALPRADAARILARMGEQQLFAPLLGGLVGFALGPRAALALGCALSAAGYLALSGASTGSLGIAGGLLAAGTGVLLPNLYAALGDATREVAPGRRVALFAAIPAAGNAAAFLAPIVTRGTGLGARATVFAAVMVAGALACGALARGGRLAEAAPPAGEAHAELWFLALGAALVPLWAGASLATPLLYGPDQQTDAAAALDFAATVGAGILATGALLALPLAKERVSPTTLLGGSLVIFGAGAAFALGGAAAAGLCFITFADTAVEPLALARVAGGPRRRWAPPIVAGWLLAGRLVHRWAAPDLTAPSGLLAVAALASAAIGVILVAARKRLPAEAASR